MGGKGVFVKEVQAAVLDGPRRRGRPLGQGPAVAHAGRPGDRGRARAGRRARRAGGLDPRRPRPRARPWPPGRCAGGPSWRTLRPDLRFVGLRGNIATRLVRLEQADVAAIVMAAAALDRLGLAERIAERLDLDVMLPQVGQGALAVECRADDDDTALPARSHRAPAEPPRRRCRAGVPGRARRRLLAAGRRPRRPWRATGSASGRWWRRPTAGPCCATSWPDRRRRARPGTVSGPPAARRPGGRRAPGRGG